MMVNQANNHPDFSAFIDNLVGTIIFNEKNHISFVQNIQNLVKNFFSVNYKNYSEFSDIVLNSLFLMVIILVIIVFFLKDKFPSDIIFSVVLFCWSLYISFIYQIKSVSTLLLFFSVHISTYNHDFFIFDLEELLFLYKKISEIDIYKHKYPALLLLVFHLILCFFLSPFYFCFSFLLFLVVCVVSTQIKTVKMFLKNHSTFPTFEEILPIYFVILFLNFCIYLLIWLFFYSTGYSLFFDPFYMTILPILIYMFAMVANKINFAMFSPEKKKKIMLSSLLRVLGFNKLGGIFGGYAKKFTEKKDNLQVNDPNKIKFEKIAKKAHKLEDISNEKLLKTFKKFGKKEYIENSKVEIQKKKKKIETKKDNKNFPSLILFFLLIFSLYKLFYATLPPPALFELTNSQIIKNTIDNFSKIQREKDIGALVFREPSEEKKSWMDYHSPELLLSVEDKYTKIYNNKFDLKTGDTISKTSDFMIKKLHLYYDNLNNKIKIGEKKEGKKEERKD